MPPIRQKYEKYNRTSPVPQFKRLFDQWREMTALIREEFAESEWREISGFYSAREAIANDLQRRIAAGESDSDILTAMKDCDVGVTKELLAHLRSTDVQDRLRRIGERPTK